MGGHISDLSRGGFLLTPYDELFVDKGSRAVLQLGHRKLDCEILDNGSGGVRCRFFDPLDLDDYERLLIIARPVAELPPVVPGALDSGGAGSFPPEQLAESVLAQLVDLAQARSACLIEASPAGIYHQTLVSLPAGAHSAGCPCEDGRCLAWEGAEGEVGDITASTDAGHHLCLRRPVSAGTLTMLLTRAPSDPPFSADELDRLAGKADELWNFLAFGHRLIRQSRQNQVLYDLFKNLSVPLFVVDGNMLVHDVNPAGAVLLRRNDGLAIKSGKLFCSTSGDDARLIQLLDAKSAAHSTGISIERTNGNHSYLASIVPASFPGGLQALHMVAVRDLDLGQQAEPEVNAKAFGLTKAEAKLARLLVQGHSLAAAAESLEISINTARTHMKHIFVKTSTNRQAQLVQLLSRSSYKI